MFVIINGGPKPDPETKPIPGYTRRQLRRGAFNTNLIRSVEEDFDGTITIRWSEDEYVRLPPDGDGFDKLVKMLNGEPTT